MLRHPRTLQEKPPHTEPPATATQPSTANLLPAAPNMSQHCFVYRHWGSRWGHMPGAPPGPEGPPG